MASPIGVVGQLLKRVQLQQGNDEWADRVHYVLAPTLLMFMATVHGMKQYFGKTIECYPPAEMAHKPWMNYAEGLCFVENTYWVSMAEGFPMKRLDRQERELQYYQWVPFLLAAQALLFILPKMLWNALSAQNSGLDINLLLERCHALKRERTSEVDKFEKARSLIGKRLDQNTCHYPSNARYRQPQPARDAGGHVMTDDNHHNFPENISSMFVSKTSSSLTILYLSFKFTNLLSTLTQLYVLNKFFAPMEYTYWGFGLLSDWFSGKDWRQSGQFPRVTFCDVQIRQPQSNRPPINYSLQCLLKMNMYNEKMFLLIWFGLIALALFSGVNFLLWLHRISMTSSARSFILDQLIAFYPSVDRLNAAEASDQFVLHKFVRHFLGRDCFLLLRLIALNCSPRLSAQIVGHVWELYRHKERMRNE